MLQYTWTLKTLLVKEVTYHTSPFRWNVWNKQQKVDWWLAGLREEWEVTPNGYRLLRVVVMNFFFFFGDEIFDNAFGVVVKGDEIFWN